MKTRAVILLMAVLGICGVARAEQSPPSEALKLNLEDCIKQGLSNSPQIKMSEANVEYAKGKVMSAGSNLVPQVKFSANAVRENMLPTFTTGAMTYYPTSFPMAGPNGPPLTPDHIHLWGFPSFGMANDRAGDVYGLKIEATYPIFTGLRAENGYKAARLQLDSSTVDLKQQRQNLVYQIKQAYYQVQLAKEMVKVVDESYATMENHYKQVKDLYKEGYVSNLDVIQVEARLSSIRPMQIQAYNGLKLAKIALASLLHLEVGAEIDVEGTLEYTPGEEKTLGEALKSAQQNRPELKSIAIRKEQTTAMVHIAEGGFMPTVALFANYQWNMGQDLPPNDKVWREGYMIGASASVPLFDGFSALGETKAARAYPKMPQAATGTPKSTA